MPIATRVLLAIDSAIWAVFALVLATGVVSLGDVDIGVTRVTALMAANAVVLGLCAWQVLRGRRLVDVAALAVVAINALLSLTDEVGFYDLAMLALSLVILTLLIIAMRVRQREDAASDAD